jgi:hypothetical protein
VSDIVVEPEDITASWLSAVLGRPVNDVTVERIGTGQIGSCFRLTIDGTERMLAKLPAADPGMREMLAGAYRGEVRFYTQIAPTVDVRVPALHHAAMSPDSGNFTLLLQDLAPWQQGDQIAGCTVDQAHDAVVNLAGLHGPRWSDPSLLEIDGLSLNGPDDAALLAEVYAPATDIFLDGLGDRLAPEDHEVLRRCVDIAEGWVLARGERFGLVHGDYRLDNLLFPVDGTRGVSAVDWQTLSLALPARDLAYFLATSLSAEVRRGHEQALVAAYHDALSKYGVTDYSPDDCWDDYRFSMIQGPLVSVFGCAYGTRTERGDAMFTVMVQRACEAIRDLDTLAVVSAPSVR